MRSHLNARFRTFRSSADCFASTILVREFYQLFVMLAAGFTRGYHRDHCDQLQPVDRVLAWNFAGSAKVGMTARLKQTFVCLLGSAAHCFFCLVGFAVMLVAPHFVSFSTRWHKVCRFGLALRPCRRKLVGMSHDDASDFRPRSGRMRDHGGHLGRHSTSFVNQILKAAAKANGGPLTATQMRGTGDVGGVGAARKGRCCRIRPRPSGSRPAEAFCRATPPGRAAAPCGGEGADCPAKTLGQGGAHLRYLQRDGTTREGERGSLMGRRPTRPHGREFVQCGREDRHRFIVAPEDGDRLFDLRAFTRDMMRQMEDDLGTRLDWVAVDHFNTGTIPAQPCRLPARTRRASYPIIAATTLLMACGCAPRSG